MTLTETTRRRFLASMGALGGFAGAGLAMPYYARGSSSRPLFTSGVQSGDVGTSSGVIWTRVDRPSRLQIEYSTSDSFSDAVRVAPIDVTPGTDLAGKILLEGLPADQEIFYRFRATDLQEVNSISDTIVGQFRTAPLQRRSVRFAWSGDTAGQGWGIDEEGMRTYSTIAYHRPDFLIHSGDTIYADNPMSDELRLRDGGVWKNRIVTDAKREIAQTLDQFRGQWTYNLLDAHVKEFNAVCPVFYQWDDHEVLNNWSPSTDLSSDDRYTEKSVSVLASRSSRAFHEMTPIRYLDDYSKRQGAEAVSNGDGGAALGRELEFSDLLRFIKDAGIANMIWLTADVHYTAAHHDSPGHAKFGDFLPFWEFVAGPLHSGT